MSAPQPPREEYGLLTPPDSPRRRRRLLRESEETSGELSIESYIHRSDPYRSTSIKDPLPYPVVHQNSSKDLTEKVLAHRVKIWKILTDNGLPSHGAFTVVDITKPDYPAGENRLTILRIIFTAVALPQKLGIAKDQIYHYLVTNQIHAVEVEILDSLNYFKPSFFPVYPDDLVIALYEKSCKAVIALLQSSIRTFWRRLDLFNVGRHKAKATPTVVITVSPRAVFDWSELRLRISQILGPRLGVEFLPGGLKILGGGKSVLEDMDSNGCPKMGTSIGVKNELGGGTLGGFFTLTRKDDGSSRNGFLTNYHVIRPAEIADTKIKDLADRFGSSFDTSDGTQSDVIFFTVNDCEATLSDAMNSLAEDSAELRKLEDELELRKTIGDKIPMRITMLRENLMERMQINEKKLEVLRAMPKHIGNVLISSGKAVCSNGCYKRIVDWAFVTLNKDILPGRNTMPNIHPRDMPEKFGHQRLALKPGDPLGEFGQLTKGEWYFKIGRSTGITAGICNGASTHCHWNDADRKRYFNGGPGQISPEVTEEFIILSQRSDQTIIEQESFCESGDSGSLIVDRKGEICGLLYGACWDYVGPLGKEEFYCNAGLAMTMPDVLSSIELKGGILDIQEV